MKKFVTKPCFLWAIILFAVRSATAGEIDGLTTGSSFSTSTGLLAVGGTAAADNDSGYQTLKAAAYTISQPASTLDISANSLYNKELRLNNSSSSLTITAGAVTALKTGGLLIDNGAISVEGGTSATAYGVNASSSGAYVTVNTNGSLVAKSGAGNGGAGLYAQKLTVNGNLTVQRGGDNAAVQIAGNSSNYLTFNASSTLTVDLFGAGELPFISANKAVINSGAQVEFVNTASIGMGQTSYAFLTTNASGLSGTFALSNLENIDIDIEARNADSYWVTFTRHTSVSTQAGGKYGPNTTRLLKGLDALLGNTDPRNAGLIADLSALENAADAGAAAKQADYMLKKYAPVDATRIQTNLRNLNDLSLRQFERNLFSPAAESGAAAASVSSSDSLASLAMTCGTVKSFWISPVAQWTSTRALTNEFVKGRENAYGVGMGFGISQEGNFAAAVGLHYLNSDFDSHTADIDSDVYGFNLYGRKYLASGCRADLFLEGGAGFSYADSDQTRKALGTTSDPDTQLYDVNLAVGADVGVGAAVVTPKIGVDYNHIHTGSYTEKGTGGLRVKSDNLDSLRGMIGVGVKAHVSDCLYLTANAAYRYEFADRNAVLTSRFVTAPDVKFVTKGEKRNRSSGEAGVGIGWQPRDNVRLGANYDLAVAEKQLGHAVSVRLALDF